MNKYWNEPASHSEPLTTVEPSATATIRTDDEHAAGAPHLREFGYMLWRRSRLILKITLYGTAAAFALGVLIAPKYTAIAEIEVEFSDQQAATMIRNDSVIETHVKTLLSRNHLQRVAAHLQGNPPTTAVTEPTKVELESLQRQPLPNLSSSWLPGPLELVHRLGIWVGGTRISSNEATLLDQLERRLKVDREGRSQIIGVSYTSTNPETAALVANRVAALYIEAAREEKRSGEAAELARIDSRLAELKADISPSAATVQELIQQRSDTTRPPNELRLAEQRLHQLQSEAVAKSQLHQMLLQRRQEFLDQQEVMTTNAHMHSFAATPDRPSSPNPFLFIFPAIVLFLICGILLSVILENLDRGLRDEREVEKVLGIPCVGLVPQLPESDQASPSQSNAVAKLLSAHAEALDAIAATMQLTFPWRQPRVILITSSLPGEGRSALAIGLSTSIARLRRRVLLIDFDSEAPSVPLLVKDVEQRDDVDLLVENATAPEVARPIPELGIDYLAMNQCSAYPLGFAAVELQRLIHKLRGDYDCVVIKGPPVFGGSETRLLATLAEETLLAVKWGSTRREFVQNALRLLRSDISVTLPQLSSIRAVITEVDLEKHARYGYGDIGEYLAKQQETSSGPSGATAAILAHISRIAHVAWETSLERIRVEAPRVIQQSYTALNRLKAKIAQATDGLKARVAQVTGRISAIRRSQADGARDQAEAS
jgi:polysaccharide biosynthesis transport protein